MPHYSRINNIDGDSAVWLGSLYNGFEANDRGIRDLTLSITEEQLNRRVNILDIIEQRTKFLQTKLLVNQKKKLDTKL